MAQNPYKKSKKQNVQKVSFRVTIFVTFINLTNANLLKSLNINFGTEIAYI
jgi:hypothetical protein